MNTKINAKYFFFGLLLVVFAFTLVLLHPFLTLLILGASIAVVLYPLYSWFNREMKWQSGWLSSVLTVFIFMIVLCVPLFFIGSAVVRQSTDVYDKLVTGGQSEIYARQFNQTIERFMPSGINFDIKDADLRGFGAITFF